MKREPLITIASITALVAALITLATSFGLDLTSDQQAGIMGVLAVSAPFAVAFAGRYQVYSPATVDRMADEAAELEPGLGTGEVVDEDSLELVGEYEDDQFPEDEDEEDDDEEDDLPAGAIRYAKA